MSILSRFNLLQMVISLFIIGGLIACGGQKRKGEASTDQKKSEKSSAKKEKQQLTIEKFADAAEQYIEKESQKNNGYFLVKDKERDSTLKLQLSKIHRKRLSHLGNNVYFVCANFYSQDSTLYDIDIFMKGTKKDNLTPTREAMVHKVEGEPRFTWYEEDGVWKTQPVKKDKEG